MLKKVIAGLVIGISIMTISSYGHAQEVTDNIEVIDHIEVTDEAIDEAIDNAKVEEEVDLSKYRIIKPEKKAYSIEDKIEFINGIAPPGTTITVEVYGTTDLTRKNFNLLFLPSEDDYIEVSTDTLVSGNSGTFSKQLELVTGINKIIIKFGVEGVPDEEIIIFVNPKNSNSKDIKRPNKLIDILIPN